MQRIAVCAMIFFYLVIVHSYRKSQTGQSGCVWIPMKRGTKSFGSTPRVGVPSVRMSSWFGLARKFGEICCPKGEVLVRSTDRMVLTWVKVGRLIGYFGN